LESPRPKEPEQKREETREIPVLKRYVRRQKEEGKAGGRFQGMRQKGQNRKEKARKQKKKGGSAKKDEGKGKGMGMGTKQRVGKEKDQR